MIMSLFGLRGNFSGKLNTPNSPRSDVTRGLVTLLEHFENNWSEMADFRLLMRFLPEK